LYRRFVYMALTLALLGTASTTQAEAAPSPEIAPSGAVPVIEGLQEQFLDVMRKADAIGYEGRYERLKSIVSESFDLPFMAEKSVGRHWKKLSAEEQERWLSSFKDMTAATYAGRFEGFSGQRFEVLGEETAKSDTVLVRALLIDPGNEDTELNYRLHRKDGQWKVLDVYLNGTVSELALRRSEYAAVLKRDGFEKLIETIDGKTQEIANASIN
jgi:phospholipid transport system substrate-binding protein